MQVVGVLQSWKQIAKCVGRTERTVERWEQQFGFPVHRPSGKSRSSVMALAQEIEEWTRDKPSLVEIRSSARLNREMLIASHTRASKDVFYAKELMQQRRLEFLRRTSLLKRQERLRGQTRDLRNQQRALLQLLRRNLEARHQIRKSTELLKSSPDFGHRRTLWRHDQQQQA